MCHLEVLSLLFRYGEFPIHSTPSLSRDEIRERSSHAALAIRAINELVVKKLVPVQFEPCLLQILEQFVNFVDMVIKPQSTLHVKDDDGCREEYVKLFFPWKCI